MRGRRPATSIASLIDHTLLAPQAGPGQVEQLCREATEYGFKAVCVHAWHVKRAASALQGSWVLPITVVGFPHGASLSAVKAFEAAQAVAVGALEIDMVLNAGALVSGDSEFVAQDIAAVVQAVPGVPVKVILETCLLSDEQKRLACVLAREAGAAFVKTSTGFGSKGATCEDVRLMRETVGAGMGVKASGGIRNLATALELIRAGADRIGTSSSVGIVLEEAGQTSGSRAEEGREDEYDR